MILIKSIELVGKRLGYFGREIGFSAVFRLIIVFKRHKAECKTNQNARQKKTRRNAQLFHGLEPEVNERVIGISRQSKNGNDEQNDFNGFHQPRPFYDIRDMSEEGVLFAAPQQDQRSRTQYRGDNSQTRFVCNQNI